MKILNFGFSFLLVLSFIQCTSEVDPVEESSLTYNIGDVGPAGGIVFYDKGETIDGWRYIEVAPNEFEDVQWGCFDQPIVDARDRAIGAGQKNTNAIVTFHDNLDDYYNQPEVCSSSNDGSVAAKLCADYTFGGFEDWFLPSSDEFLEMYNVLHLNGLGDFSVDRWIYWSSTEFKNESAEGDNVAIATDFETGGQSFLCKDCGFVAIVRPVRYF